MLRSDSLIFSPTTHALGIRVSEEAGSLMPPSALQLARFRIAFLVAKAAGGPDALGPPRHWDVKELWKAAARNMFISGGYSAKRFEFHSPPSLLL